MIRKRPIADIPSKSSRFAWIPEGKVPETRTTARSGDTRRPGNPVTVKPTVRPSNPTQRAPGGSNTAGVPGGGFDPVVGWLVCVKGPTRGRDYRIRDGQNFLGRDLTMDICIPEDRSVSAENHARIIYDSRQLMFKLAQGSGSGLTYHNGKAVDLPVELQAFDTVTVGESDLLFVPFCGDRFKWA